MSNKLPFTIVVGGLVAPEDYVTHGLPVATVAETNRALLCREYGLADDASEAALGEAIMSQYGGCDAE